MSCKLIAVTALVCVAGLLVAEEQAGTVWATLTGLLILQALQAVSVLAAGVLMNTPGVPAPRRGAARRFRNPSSGGALRLAQPPGHTQAAERARCLGGGPGNGP